MNPTVRNILTVIGALIIGGVINAGIIQMGPSIIPAPEGVNPNDIESIKANVNLYSAKHFIVPFLAHAIGTLAGAYTVCRLAASNHKKLALLVGAFFLLGGIMMAIALPEFWKFSIVDLIFAYFPFAILGWKLAGEPK